MLQRIERNGVVLYQSPLLAGIGIPHAFSTRIGGVSVGPFASLNFGNPNGAEQQDSLDNIAENYRRLFEAASLSSGALCRVHQVHGCGVALAGADEAFDVHQQADAIVSTSPGQVATVRVADCVPALMALPDGSRVAAIHAGWRGLIAGVALQALERLLAGTQVAPQQVIAAIGPSIGYDAFEVGPEVLAAFADRFGSSAPLRRRADGKGHVDLKESLRVQLAAAGLKQIDTTDQCTVTNRNDFFSHRRDAGLTGRMVAAIAPLAAG